MQLVHLPAMRRRSLETLSHTAPVRGRTCWPTASDAASCSTPPTPRCCRCCALRASRSPRTSTAWSGSAPSGAAPASATTAWPRRSSVRWSDALIADAQGIADYYRDEFGAPTEQIAYGAPKIAGGASDKLAELGLTPRGYHLVVARFEPENHVDVIVDGYRRSGAVLPLVVVGSAPYADEYTRQVHGLADDRVRFLGGVWDQELLDQLYANCATYLHGHSVGGTNPSLLRAMGAGAATIAYDVAFNREVLQTSGRYFTTPSDVAAEVAAAEADPVAVRRDGNSARMMATRYDWDDVAARYEALCARLAARDFPRTRPSGRRVPQLATTRTEQATEQAIEEAIEQAPVQLPVPRRPVAEPELAPIRLAIGADAPPIEVPTARAAQA